jgi:multiple sugar transport system permease protein
MVAISKRLRASTPLLLSLPSILLVVAIAIYPILFAFALSLTNRRLDLSEYRFIWFKNYIDMFLSGDFWHALLVTVQYTLVAVGMEMLLGFSLALLLSQALRGRTVFRILLLIPLMLPPATGALMWKALLDPSMGWINYALRQVGIQAPAWLGASLTAPYAVALIDVYHYTPFVALILLAGLQSIPRLQYEVAEVDGASGWQVFRMVTLPQLTPTIYLVLLFRLVLSLNSYDIIQVATNGGPGNATTTLAFHATQLSFRYYAFGQAGAFGIFMFFVILNVAQRLFVKVSRSWA